MAKKIGVSELMRLLNSQDSKCALTGRELTPSNCTLDHKKPLSSGGSHDITNLQLVVSEANTAKGTMEMEEFVGLCRDVAARYGLSCQCDDIACQVGRVLPASEV